MSEGDEGVDVKKFNKKRFENSEYGGCYYCCRTFKLEGREYDDLGCAICPHCQHSQTIPLTYNNKFEKVSLTMLKRENTVNPQILL